MRNNWITSIVAAFIIAMPLLAYAGAPPGAVVEAASGAVTAIDYEKSTLTIAAAGVFHVPVHLADVLEEVVVGDGVDVEFTGENEVTDLRIHDPM